MISFRTLLFASLVAIATAQVPGFGWCPEYAPMENFDLNKYLGIWYEQERYFTVLEAGSRCVRSNYTLGTDAKFRVSNEITNRLTGIRRVLDGAVQNIGKGGEGKISVKYNTLPVPIDTQYSVLNTDYDTYSVVWSCSSLGPINTQNAWVMTRDRLAPGTVLQEAYGVLDKFKISRTFFVKTDQSDCVFENTEGAKVGEKEKSADPIPEASPAPAPVPVPEPAKKPDPVMAPVAEKKPEPEKKPEIMMEPVPTPKPIKEEKPVEAKPMKEEPAKVEKEPMKQ